MITDSVCEQRMQIAKQTGEPHFYMMELAPGLIIDARSKGNVARLINSSCAPNCESQKWHDAANGASILAAHLAQPCLHTEGMHTTLSCCHALFWPLQLSISISSLV